MGWALFFAGAVVGATLGVLIAGAIAAGKMEDAIKSLREGSYHDF